MREHHILNLGAGVQSTALYLLARESAAKFHLDLAIFADSVPDLGASASSARGKKAPSIPP